MSVKMERRPDINVMVYAAVDWLESVNKAAVQRGLPNPPAFRCMSCRKLVMDDGLSCYHAYDPAVALVKFHAGLSDLRCMLVDLLGVSDEQHFLLLSYPISELVNLLHRKKDQKIGTLKKEDNPVFLKACNEILELISLWNYSDQDRATFVKSMQLLMSITKFFGREEEPLSTMWSYAFCCSSDAGWHLRKKEHTDKLGTSTAKGSY